MITKDELKNMCNFNKGLTALIDRNIDDLKRLKDDKQVIFTKGKIYAYQYVQKLFTNALVETINDAKVRRKK